MITLCTLEPREICVPVGLMKKAIEVGRFSLETAFIIQEKEFIVAKTYHAACMNVLCLQAFGAKNGLHAFVNSLVV